jgi:hypothetical protein
VSARFLMAVFDSIYVTTLAGWIGSALFLALGVCPLISKQLGAKHAEKLLRHLLARYCLWGAICGALCLSSMVAVPLCYPEYRGVRVGVQALVIIACIASTLYPGNSSTPAPNTASASIIDPAHDRQVLPLFRQAYLQSAVVAIAGIALLIAFATRPAPKTSGIVELTPAEQSRYDEALGRVIKQVEVKYGFRQPSLPRPGEPSQIGPVIDSETVKEIEGYYAEKRRKEDARRGRPAAAKPARGTGPPPSPPRPAP